MGQIPEVDRFVAKATEHCENIREFIRDAKAEFETSEHMRRAREVGRAKGLPCVITPEELRGPEQIPLPLRLERNPGPEAIGPEIRKERKTA